MAGPCLLVTSNVNPIYIPIKPTIYQGPGSINVFDDNTYSYIVRDDLQ